jgi:hypothetical protein
MGATSNNIGKNNIDNITNAGPHIGIVSITMTATVTYEWNSNNPNGSEWRIYRRGGR